MPTPKRHRIQLDFSDVAFRRLQALKEASAASSNAEVIRRTLLLYDWFLTQQRAGNIIQVIDGDSVREITFIF